MLHRTYSYGRSIKILECKFSNVFERDMDLLDTLIANREGCVGMAANMTGVRKRIIVFDNKELKLIKTVIYIKKLVLITHKGCSTATPFIIYLNRIPLLARNTAAPTRAPSANCAIGTLSRARSAAIFVTSLVSYIWFVVQPR